MSSPDTAPSAQDRLLTAVFFALLLTPLAAALGARALGLRGTPSYGAENRAPAEFPAPPASVVEWGAFPRAFESWHDDHFGLRAPMLRAHAWLSVFVLRSDPSPRLIVGRERWIYSPRASLDLWRGAQPFEAGELEAWARAVESRREELARRGILYRFALVPSKAELYPDRLPGRFVKSGPSRLEQFTAAWRGSDAWVDLRPSLEAARGEDRGDDFAYYPLGTHWTDRGALAGTRELVRSLATAFPALAAVPDDAGPPRPVKGPGDSLAQQMFLGDVIVQSCYGVEFTPAARRDIRITMSGSDGHGRELREVLVEQDDPALPRALVFHDSFGMPLPELFGRHFSRAVFRWQPDVDFAAVDAEQPDVVLQIVSDRVLSLPPPREVDTRGEARVRESFAAAKESALVLDVAAHSPRITPYGGGRVFPRGAGAAARVVCASESPADAFLLPGFSVPEGRHAVVRIAFTSSVASSASLLFQMRGDPSYSRRRQVRFETHIGENELVCELLAPDLAGRLLFRPALEAGTFEVSALEVRLVED